MPHDICTYITREQKKRQAFIPLKFVMRPDESAPVVAACWGQARESGWTVRDEQFDGGLRAKVGGGRATPPHANPAPLALAPSIASSAAGRGASWPACGDVSGEPYVTGMGGAEEESASPAPRHFSRSVSTVAVNFEGRP